MTAAALWDFDAHSGAVRMTGLRRYAYARKKPLPKEGQGLFRTVKPLGDD